MNGTVLLVSVVARNLKKFERLQAFFVNEPFLAVWKRLDDADEFTYMSELLKSLEYLVKGREVIDLVEIEL
jgi:hypothetical protein